MDYVTPSEAENIRFRPKLQPRSTRAQLVLLSFDLPGYVHQSVHGTNERDSGTHSALSAREAAWPASFQVCRVLGCHDMGEPGKRVSEAGLAPCIGKSC